jgi:hypothetical protein
MDPRSGSIDSVSRKKKHKTESDTIDPALHFYISSGNLAILTNARVRSLGFAPRPFDGFAFIRFRPTLYPN